MFRLLRFYSVASFFSILITAVLLAAFYHKVSSSSIARMAESNNLSLARTALSALRPDLVSYLRAFDGADANELLAAHLPEGLATVIKGVMQEGAVTRIKIYDRRGMVVFSTTYSQIGHDSSSHPEFRTAINGTPVSHVFLRDSFNSFVDSSSRDSLVESYLPVRGSATESVDGVLELYTDVSSLVEMNERTTYSVMIGAGLILMLLYTALLLASQHARGIIEKQQQTIRERNTTLEILSARMLLGEEQQKKKIAFELHEGLAQSLSAIKMLLESQAGEERVDPALQAIIPGLQSAIQEVREMAMELHPSSLEELGLLPTVEWMCRRFEELHPQLRLELDISIQEHRIPTSLKAVIYRVIAAAFTSFAQGANGKRLRLELSQEDREVSLEMELAPLAGTAQVLDASSENSASAVPDARFVEVQERVILSGGRFGLIPLAGGGMRLRAIWDYAPRRLE